MIAPPAVTPSTFVTSSYKPSDKKGKKFAYLKKAMTPETTTSIEKRICGLKMGDLYENSCARRLQRINHPIKKKRNSMRAAGA